MSDFNILAFNLYKEYNILLTGDILFVNTVNVTIKIAV